MPFLVLNLKRDWPLLLLEVPENLYGKSDYLLERPCGETKRRMSAKALNA